MNKNLIQKSFKTYLQWRDLKESSLSLDLFPAIFIDYFQAVKFKEVDEENDGDMLLFQYGIYDWGKGIFFELNFTRQFYRIFPKSYSHRIYQLGVTFFYSPNAFKEIKTLTKWSSDCKNLEEFQHFILNSQGFKTASKEIPIKSENQVTLV